ncbi:uncharacterized protein LOC132262948 [Phlebotomus argentipes]|uniref:uncharacterized protein LOC132262948 n=1 Tax=Phlebotomus argentipes TaxID=94469 RepID=UPI002892E616|nr:uncharacterized protein LOC132262948 [Phlebotomus argentipes]
MFPKKSFKHKLPEELQHLAPETDAEPKEESNAEGSDNSNDERLKNILGLRNYLDDLEHSNIKPPDASYNKYVQDFEEYVNLRPPTPEITLEELSRVPIETKAEVMANRSAYEKGLMDGVRVNPSEVELFGQFVVTMLRRMNESSRFTTMSKISSILFENFLTATSTDVQMKDPQMSKPRPS